MQKNVDGRLEEWKSEVGETVLRASTADAYPGVTLERALRLKDDSLEDRFTCASKEAHVYDWAFHAAQEGQAPRAGAAGRISGNSD